MSTELGIPYYEIPRRTRKTEDGIRLGKFALIGFLERRKYEMDNKEGGREFRSEVA